MTSHDPIPCALHNEAGKHAGYVPAIYYPGRTVAYLQFARFARKTKATATEAVRYAEAVLVWRAVRKHLP